MSVVPDRDRFVCLVSNLNLGNRRGGRHTQGADAAHCGSGARYAALTPVRKVGGVAMDPSKIKSRENSTNEFDLPQFPGEDFLAHAGAQWKEQAEARLAKRHLLTVAQGQQPSSAKCIIDVDLSAMPELSVTHRDYQRRLEIRTRTLSQNAANAEKR